MGKWLSALRVDLEDRVNLHTAPGASIPILSDFRWTELTSFEYLIINAMYQCVCANSKWLVLVGHRNDEVKWG